jgi:putative peptidoglycan lipid II flippase
MLIILLLLILKNSVGIAAAVIALLVGYIFNLIWLLAIMKKKINWFFSSGISVPSKKIIYDILLMQVNILPVSIRGYLIVYVLSGLGAGVVTAVNYGQQIVLIPEVFVLTQAVSILGIRMNDLTAKGFLNELSVFYSKILNILFYILIPIACLLALYSKEVTSLLFLRNNFTPAIKNILIQVVTILALILPIKALDSFMTLLITSQQKIGQSFWYGTVMHLVIGILFFVAIKNFEVTGYLSATLISYYLIMPLVFYFLCKKIASFVNYNAIIKDGVKIAAVNIFISIIIYCFNVYIGILLPGFLKAAIGAILFLFSLACLSTRFNLSPHFWQKIRLFRPRRK